MKTREIACQHYIHEHNCDLGKEAEFYGHCQTCKNYKKLSVFPYISVHYKTP